MTKAVRSNIKKSGLLVFLLGVVVFWISRKTEFGMPVLHTQSSETNRVVFSKLPTNRGNDKLNGAARSKHIAPDRNPAIEEFRLLSLKFRETELESQQIDFIQSRSASLSGSEAVRFFQELLPMVSEKVILQAGVILGQRLFSGSLDSGIEALNRMTWSPACSGFAASAGASLCDMTPRQQKVVLEDESIPDQFLKCIANRFFISMAMKGRLDSGTINLAFAQLEKNSLTVKDFSTIISMAKIGTDFNYLWQKATTNGESAVLAGTIKAWASCNPTACVAAIATEGSPQLLSDSIGGVVANWFDLAPNAAADWVKAQGDSPVKDLSICTLSKKLAKISPNDSLDWALSVKDETKRLRNLSELNQLLISLHGKEMANKMLISRHSHPTGWLGLREEIGLVSS